MDTSTLGPVNVKLYGTTEPEGEEIERCKITLLGASPNATVSLWQWDADANRFVEFDKLRSAEIAEHGDRVSIQGISDTLLRDVELAPANARVRWEVSIKDCQSC